MKNKKIVLFTVLVLAIGFIVAVMYYQNSMDTKDQDVVSNKKGSPFFRDHSPSFGENKNQVIITEFLDPVCEACRAFHPIIKEVFNNYKVETKLVIRYLAYHENSKFAIKLLEAARLQNRYNEALTVIFKYQPKWAKYYKTKPQLLWELLPEAGLDMKKLKKDFESIDVDKILTLDKMDADTLAVGGTPTFYVNGRKLRKLSHKGLLDLVKSEIYK